MTACTKIIGGNATGITALTGANQLISLDDNKITTSWRGSTPMQQVAQSTPASPSAPAMVGIPQGMCGNNPNGVAVYTENTISYLSCVENLQANWKSLVGPAFLGSTNPETTAPAGIQGMVGDPVNGLTAFGYDAYGVQQVAQLAPADAVPAWKAKLPPPFVVSLIAGDNLNGVLVVGSKDQPNPNGGSQVSRSGPDCSCEWKCAVSISFNVELVCGDSINGFVLYGEGQMTALDSKNALIKLPSLNFSIMAMTGNAKEGLAAILVGGTIASCADLTQAQWVVIGGPAPEGPASTAGSGTSGSATGGSGTATGTGTSGSSATGGSGAGLKPAGALPA